MPQADSGTADRHVRRAVHATIKGIGQDVEGFRFNTMVSKLMILRNELKRVQTDGNVGRAAWDEAIRTFLLLSAPVFPHLAEELWTEVLGLPYSIHQQAWPAYDEAMLIQSQTTLVVQVNGKVRDQVVLDADLARDEAKVRELVMELPRIKQHTAGMTVQRIIVVPGKLANIVVR